MGKKKNYYSKIIAKYLPKILKSIIKEYKIGSLFSIKLAQGDGVKTSSSPSIPTKQETEIYLGEITEAITGMSKYRTQKINQIINEGILNRESGKQVAQNLKDLFSNDSSESYHSDATFVNLARTYSTEILSQSSEKKALQLGAIEKYVSTVNDKRRSIYCDAIDSKYGEENKSIPVNENFKVEVKVGKKVKFVDKRYSPFHFSCRSIVIYKFDV